MRALIHPTSSRSLLPRPSRSLTATTPTRLNRPPHNHFHTNLVFLASRRHKRNSVPYDEEEADDSEINYKKVFKANAAAVRKGMNSGGNEGDMMRATAILDNSVSSRHTPRMMEDDIEEDDGEGEVYINPDEPGEDPSELNKEDYGGYAVEPEEAAARESVQEEEELVGRHIPRRIKDDFEDDDGEGEVYINPDEPGEDPSEFNKEDYGGYAVEPEEAAAKESVQEEEELVGRHIPRRIKDDFEEDDGEGEVYINPDEPGEDPSEFNKEDYGGYEVEPEDESAAKVTIEEEEERLIGKHIPRRIADAIEQDDDGKGEVYLKTPHS